METNELRFPSENQHDIQLAFEAMNDWHLALDQLDRRRPWYFSALISSWFATLATGFEPSRIYLIWLVGRLGIVAIWFGAISFFVVYATTYIRARRIEKQMSEVVQELKQFGLRYVPRNRSREPHLVHASSGRMIDPYEDSLFA